VRRISVVGTSGSGKSWLATKVSSKLGLPYLELDALRHQPDWQPLPDAEFLHQVRRFVEQDGWVVDGNYFSVVTGPAIWPAADTVIWVDPSRATVMRQVIWRTLKRGVLRQELWNGNRENLRDLFRWDPYKSIIRWSWTSYGVVRERYQTSMGNKHWQHLQFVRLRSQDDIDRFLDRL